MVLFQRFIIPVVSISVCNKSSVAGYTNNLQSFHIVKVQDVMVYGWCMILHQFLDNSDSPSYSGAVITEGLM